MATARCSSPANYPEINGTTSSASRRSPTPSSIASCTTPIGWNWTGRPCVKSMPPSRLKLMLDHPRRKSPAPYLRQPSQQKGIRNDRRAQLPARPGGSTGTSRARRCASRESAPRRARVPPIYYRDGLSPCLTSHQETDITTTIQRRRQRPRHTGRNRSEQVVAIVGMPTDTQYWHDHVADKADIWMLKGRLRFGDGAAPSPFPSTIVVWGGTSELVARLSAALPDAWHVPRPKPIHVEPLIRWLRPILNRDGS